MFFACRYLLVSCLSCVNSSRSICLRVSATELLHESCRTIYIFSFSHFLYSSWFPASVFFPSPSTQIPTQKNKTLPTVSREEQNVEWANRIRSEFRWWLKYVAKTVKECKTFQSEMCSMPTMSATTPEYQTTYKFFNSKFKFVSPESVVSGRVAWLLWKLWKTWIRTTNGILICSFAIRLMRSDTWHMCVGGGVRGACKLQETRTNHLNTLTKATKEFIDQYDFIWRRQHRS